MKQFHIKHLAITLIIFGYSSVFASTWKIELLTPDNKEYIPLSVKDARISSVSGLSVIHERPEQGSCILALEGSGNQFGRVLLQSRHQITGLRVYSVESDNLQTLRTDAHLPSAQGIISDTTMHSLHCLGNVLKTHEEAAPTNSTIDFNNCATIIWSKDSDFYQNITGTAVNQILLRFNHLTAGNSKAGGIFFLASPRTRISGGQLSLQSDICWPIPTLPPESRDVAFISRNMPTTSDPASFSFGWRAVQYVGQRIGLMAPESLPVIDIVMHLAPAITREFVHSIDVIIIAPNAEAPPAQHLQKPLSLPEKPDTSPLQEETPRITISERKILKTMNDLISESFQTPDALRNNTADGAPIHKIGSDFYKDVEQILRSRTEHLSPAECKLLIEDLNQLHKLVKDFPQTIIRKMNDIKHTRQLKVHGNGFYQSASDSCILCLHTSSQLLLYQFGTGSSCNGQQLKELIRLASEFGELANRYVQKFDQSKSKKNPQQQPQMFEEKLTSAWIFFGDALAQVCLRIDPHRLAPDLIRFIRKQTDALLRNLGKVTATPMSYHAQMRIAAIYQVRGEWEKADKCLTRICSLDKFKEKHPNELENYSLSFDFFLLPIIGRSYHRHRSQLRNQGACGSAYNQFERFCQAAITLDHPNAKDWLEDQRYQHDSLERIALENAAELQHELEKEEQIKKKIEKLCKKTTPSTPKTQTNKNPSSAEEKAAPSEPLTIKQPPSEWEKMLTDAGQMLANPQQRATAWTALETAMRLASDDEERSRTELAMGDYWLLQILPYKHKITGICAYVGKHFFILEQYKASGWSDKQYDPGKDKKDKTVEYATTVTDLTKSMKRALPEATKHYSAGFKLMDSSPLLSPELQGMIRLQVSTATEIHAQLEEAQQLIEKALDLHHKMIIKLKLAASKGKKTNDTTTSTRQKLKEVMTTTQPLVKELEEALLQFISSSHAATESDGWDIFFPPASKPFMKIPTPD